MADLTNLSWFKKYQPKTIEEYVFEKNEYKDQILSWMDNGMIPGNLLLYGNAGTGKTALAQLLIRSIVKNQYDVEKVKDKSVAAIDELRVWCQKQPITSKQKIVYIEELDRASSAAMNSLKDGLMESFQPHVAFVATTNFINRIEYPVQTRFNFTFNLGTSNLEGIYTRLDTILNTEQIPFEVEDLKNFIIDNHGIGLRNMINLLQINVKNGAINFSEIKSVKSEQEELIEDLIMEMIKTFKGLSFNEQMMAKNLPLNSPIAPAYTKIMETINFNMDINYSTIYLDLYEKFNYIPLKLKVDTYLHESEYKRYQNIHFISFIHDILKVIIDLGI